MIEKILKILITGLILGIAGFVLSDLIWAAVVLIGGILIILGIFDMFLHREYSMLITCGAVLLALGIVASIISFGLYRIIPWTPLF